VQTSNHRSFLVDVPCAQDATLFFLFAAEQLMRRVANWQYNHQHDVP
jgi:hypothetical protein